MSKDPINEELIMMRTELHRAYYPYLSNFYDSEDIKKALSMFLSVPSASRVNKSSIICLLELCEIAKSHRENK